MCTWTRSGSTFSSSAATWSMIVRAPVPMSVALTPTRNVPSGSAVTRAPDGAAIDLSQREWAIFEALLRAPGAVLSRARLEEHLYSFDAEVESNTIEVYVSRLRRKLGRGSIETLRGLGYRLGRQ